MQILLFGSPLQMSRYTHTSRKLQLFMACLVTYHAIILHWKYFWWYLLISKVAYLLTLNIWYFWYLVWGADHLQTLFSKILAHYWKREREREIGFENFVLILTHTMTSYGLGYTLLMASTLLKMEICSLSNSQRNQHESSTPQGSVSVRLYIFLCASHHRCY